jgi:hypothetical protein
VACFRRLTDLLARFGPSSRIVLACAATSACGGRLVPVDVAFDAGDAALVDAEDASTVVDSGEEESASLPCDYDASADYDAATCTPPAADVLYANPPLVSVAADSYGLATFVASGPWTNDPRFFMRYEGSTLPLQNVVYATSYGTPQSLPFLVANSAAGQQGTLTVSAHAGNIERIAHVTVTITSCAPHAQYCNDMECGFEGEGCRVAGRAAAARPTVIYSSASPARSSCARRATATTSKTTDPWIASLARRPSRARRAGAGIATA